MVFFPDSGEIWNQTSAYAAVGSGQVLPGKHQNFAVVARPSAKTPARLRPAGTTPKFKGGKPADRDQK